MKHRIVLPLIAMLGLVSAPGFAESSYSERLASLDAQLSSLEQEFSVHRQSIRTPSLDERLEDGIILQAAGDHQRASYIFMDIVLHEEWRGKPGYQAAQLQLARSLYEDGYYRLSQRYLIDLLKNGVGSERTDGVMLLLQAAQQTGDWAEVNAALANTSDFSRSPAYLYIMGRAMFLQGDNETARTCLQGVENNRDEWAVKAEYLLGVLDIQDANFDSAMLRFERVAADTSSFRGSDDIHTLAVLAQARLYYEQTQWSKAIDKYQQVSESSTYFPAVLYEMGWTHIRLEDYTAAQQKFELLLLSYPEDHHALETRRLLADLKRELGQYDEAVASYQKIVDEFSPVMTQMETESADMNSRKAQLRQRIESEEYDDVQIVPERAKGLVAVGTDVNRVERMLNSLTESDANTAASENIVAEINAALQSDNSVRNLPEFQQFTHQARDIRVNALLIGHEFTDDYANTDSLAPVVSEVSKLPRNQQERAVLKALQNSEREEREARYHHLKLQGESLKHRTRILKSWLDSGRAQTLSENEKQRITEQISSLENQLNSLKSSQDAIEFDLAKLRTNIGSSSDTGEEEQNINTLRAQLERIWSQSSGGDQEYRSLIAQEQSLLNRLDTFDNGINASIHERVSDIKSRLERESLMVATEKERYVAMKTDVGEAAGDISARYWQSVYEQIRDMVLTADLGMVDIAWLQKDARSKALSTAMEERKKEREVLEQDFRQFLKESGQE